jgi:hypothetical protein
VLSWSRIPALRLAARHAHCVAAIGRYHHAQLQRIHHGARQGSRLNQPSTPGLLGSTRGQVKHLLCPDFTGPRPHPKASRGHSFWSVLGFAGIQIRTRLARAVCGGSLMANWHLSLRELSVLAVEFAVATAFNHFGSGRKIWPLTGIRGACQRIRKRGVNPLALCDK